MRRRATPNHLFVTNSASCRLIHTTSTLGASKPAVKARTLHRKAETLQQFCALRARRLRGSFLYCITHRSHKLIEPLTGGAGKETIPILARDPQGNGFDLLPGQL
jgi:hypothetical protein